MPTHPVLNALLALDQAATPARRGRAKPIASGTSKADTAFAAQGRLPAGNLTLVINALGQLPSPMPRDWGERLRGTSRPARFGKRERTLLDAQVRDTGEIAADALSLTWAAGAQQQLLREVAAALNLDALDAQLHNLLVYGKGQFFKPHQDTEKHPRMVATLVLIWPSDHIGGTLRVQHAKQSQDLESQQLDETEPRWLAFYADCRHEVLPVQAGWRVALSFDLMLPAGVPQAPSQADPRLRNALSQVFGLPDAPNDRPWMLLLDHEYTEHGLRWPLLKGADRPRVAALRAAAGELDLVMYLALAELHESWTAQPAGRRSEAVEPDELIDDSLTLDYWLDEQGQVVSRSSVSFEAGDATSLVDNGPEHLVDEQYEGYMGNYGETLDYWYRRAALVLWTPQADASLRFRLDFKSALADLLTSAGHAETKPQLSAQVAAAAQPLKQAVGTEGRVLLKPYAKIAAALDSDDLALDLMAPFEPATFEAGDASPLARLASQRGAPWMQALLQRWTSGSSASRWSESLPAAHSSWPQPLPAFIEQCLSAGMDSLVVRVWLELHFETLSQCDRDASGATPFRRQAAQDDRIQSACEWAGAVQLMASSSADLLESLLAHMAQNERLYPPAALVPLVQAISGKQAPAIPAGASLMLRVQAALREMVDRPDRAATDHGLYGIEWTCRCADCKPVIAWAESPEQRPLLLPMAESRRRHVEQSLQAAAAPIATATVKQGSPHKLQLSKPGNLHAKDRAVRATAAQQLKALGKA